MRHRLTILLLTAALLLSGCADLLEEEPTGASSTGVPTWSPGSTAPSAGSVVDPTVLPGADGAAWTVLVYMDGDNDLEQSALDDFSEMASVGSTDQVNIVVQLDRVRSDEEWDATESGNWASAKRFRIQRGQQPTSKQQLQDLGEVNMGDPATLTDFAVWGVKQFPARRYALIFWDHGASWPGITSDSTSEDDTLTLPELAEAFQAVRAQTKVDRFDLIGFDACLMSQIDVLQTVAPFGKVAVGSADLEPGEGWAWNSWLGSLTRRPNREAVEVAPEIVRSFGDFFRRQGETSVTLAAFDLTKMDQLSQSFTTFSKTLLTGLDTSYDAIGAARAYAHEYGEGDSSIGAIDLGYLTRSLVREAASPQIVAAAKGLDASIRAARITYTRGADQLDSTGISVYFPWTPEDYDAQYAAFSPLSTSTGWDAFLRAFHKIADEPGGQATVDEPQASSGAADEQTPATISATVRGDRTAYVSYTVGRYDPQDPSVYIELHSDYLYPPGSGVGGGRPSWPKGQTDVELRWPATAWYLGNGADTALTPFAPLDYGSGTYSVSGIYKTKKTGRETPVSLEFEVADGHGTLARVWAFDRDKPRELTPRAGDRFFPTFTTYTGDDATEGELRGDPITFGKTPLTAFEGPAPSGDYSVGLLVESLSGRVKDSYAEVSVAAGRKGPSAPPAAPQRGGTYTSAKLGVSLAPPADWRVRTVGTDRLLLDDPAAEDGASLAVDVLPLGEKGSAASQAILDEVIKTLQTEPGYAAIGSVSNVTVAGRPALRLDYQITGEDASLRGAALVMTDDASGTTYLLTLFCDAQTYASRAATFDGLIGSFSV